MNRRLPALGAALLFGMSLIACRKSGSVVPAVKPTVGFGDDWLSMTTYEKTIFVDGFIEGRHVGAEDICDTGAVILPRKPKPGDENLSEYGRCEAMSGQYSHLDPKTGDDAYIRVIDAFYSHPECRTMPYDMLLEHLNDSEYKSGEELYQYVRSGLVWGPFTGPKGFEKCYGAALNRNFGG